MGIHSTGILLEKMGAKQGCWNSTSSTTPIKVYCNAPFLPARASEQGNVIGLVSVYMCT